jgi:curved DNA-binding protein CbpA
MTDAFALLGLPRRAALDEAQLQAAWHERSRAAHPDTAGGDAALAADINAAHEILGSPEKRLKHLLELNAVPWRAIPLSADWMDLFSQTGTALQSAAALVKKKQAASSALARALLAPQEMRLREQIEALNENLETRRAALLAGLPAIEDDLAALQAAQASFAYLGKWQAQLREALLTLM